MFPKTQRKELGFEMSISSSWYPKIIKEIGIDLPNWRLKTSVADDDFIDVFALDVLNKLLLEVSLELLVRNVSIDWTLQYTRNVSVDLFQPVQIVRQENLGTSLSIFNSYLPTGV